MASVEAIPNNGNVEAIPETFLMMSGDVGNTWRAVPSPPGAVAFQDSVHWWAINSTLFKSTNAGQSWGQVTTIPADWHFTTPGVLDRTHGWAAVFGPAGYGLALTNDGGIHWTLANVPNPPISP